MKLIRKCGMVLLFLGMLIPLAAQNSSGSSGSNEQLTIEELFLSQDIDIQIMRSQALATDRESKLLALQTIRSSISSGSVGEGDPQAIAILDSLAGEGVYRVVRQGGSVINDFPEVRRQAANLLGEIGGTNAKNVLVKMLDGDPEPMVLSEAVFALGKIGINDNEVTLRLVQVLRRNNAAALPDNNLAFATLLAFEQLASVGSGIARPDILQSIIEVLSSNYIQVVKLKALDLLTNLRK